MDFEPAVFPTLDGFTWRPIQAGLWRQKELRDGTYDFADLLDIHEMLDTKHENERRHAKAHEKR